MGTRSGITKMSGRILLLLSLAVLGTQANCPGTMELINQKCYMFGVASSRADALKQCQAVDPSNHLWIINHQLEMDQVMEWFSKRLIDVGARSYQGCSCDQGDINFICESADEVDFDCPDDGFFESGPCSDLWYNCWNGHATPEYCEEGLVFNQDVGYCDFPENTTSC